MARDLVMAAGAYALARIAPAREASRSNAREDRSRPAGAHACDPIISTLSGRKRP
jgi:hypothetical protein